MIFKTRREKVDFHFLWNKAKAAPSHLYHYTGNTGLRGIVSTTSFWATDVRFLNDAKEVEIALDAVRRVVQKTSAKNPRPYASLLCNEVFVQLHVDSRSLYVFSLTEKGDSLSHWRGYCKDQAGYAIGFKFEELAEWCQSAGLMLSNVTYGTEIYSRDLGRLLSCDIEELDSYFPFFGEGEINSDLLKSYAKRFAQRALTYAPFVKHEGFAEENEWRIVRFVSKREDRAETFFREGAHSLLPYTILPLEPAPFFSALGIINVKRTEHSDLCNEGLRDFVGAEAGKHGLRETMSLLTEVSTIPFRPGF